jgi:carbon starvation protein CstA
MITESIIALVWAAIAMSFWGGVQGLNETLAANGNKAAILVDAISRSTLGEWLSWLVIGGVIAAAITSGDTAFRSARLIVADFTGIDQRPLWKRIAVSAPLFALGLCIILAMDFRTMWSYFAWMNQSLAVITLWAITVWLYRRGKPFLLAMVPAVAMTYICSSYAMLSPIMLGMANHTAAYLWGAVPTLAITVFFTLKFRKK